MIAVVDQLVIEKLRPVDVDRNRVEDLNVAGVAVENRVGKTRRSDKSRVLLVPTLLEDLVKVHVFHAELSEIERDLAADPFGERRRVADVQVDPHPTVPRS